MPVDNPAPNQSTVDPDFGIQNDNAGATGAWMVDQAGVANGSPSFFDYLLIGRVRVEIPTPPSLTTISVLSDITMFPRTASLSSAAKANDAADRIRRS